MHSGKESNTDSKPYKIGTLESRTRLVLHIPFIGCEMLVRTMYPLQLMTAYFLSSRQFLISPQRSVLKALMK